MGLCTTRPAHSRQSTISPDAQVCVCERERERESQEYFRCRKAEGSGSNSQVSAAVGLKRLFQKQKKTTFYYRRRGLKTSLKVHKYYCMETYAHTHSDKQPAKAGLIETWPPVDVSGYLFITMRRTDSREFVSPFQTRLPSLPWLSTF